MHVSKRLTYRRCTGDDAGRLLTHWNRPEVRRYLWDDLEVTPEGVAGVLDRGARAHSGFGGGLWLLSVDASFVGTCGLLPVFDELKPMLRSAIVPGLLQRVGPQPMVEVLFSLEPDVWGRGYAVEATRAMLDYGHHEVLSNFIFGGTDLANERSERTLRSAGMTEVARFEGSAGPVIYFVSEVDR